MSTTAIRNVCVTGNIGSGKSTLVRLLARSFNSSYAVPEQFEENRFLEPFLKDQPRWGFTSAVHYYLDYALAYANATRDGGDNYRFIDAGIMTNRMVYGRYMLGEHKMTPEEYAFYETLCEVINKAYAVPLPDAYVFVEASPRTCYERMLKRGWEYQVANISFQYIETLQPYFDGFKEWVAARGLPILLMDSEKTDWTTPEGQAEAVGQVGKLIKAPAS